MLLSLTDFDQVCGQLKIKHPEPTPEQLIIECKQKPESVNTTDKSSHKSFSLFTELQGSASKSNFSASIGWPAWVLHKLMPISIPREQCRYYNTNIQNTALELTYCFPKRKNICIFTILGFSLNIFDTYIFLLKLKLFNYLF